MDELPNGIPVTSVPRLQNSAPVRYYSDDIIGTMAPQIAGFSIVGSAVCSGAGERKYQSSASLAFVRGIHRWPVNSSHKGPVTQKMCPFHDVIMGNLRLGWKCSIKVFYLDDFILDQNDNFWRVCRIPPCSIFKSNMTATTLQINNYSITLKVL